MTLRALHFSDVHVDVPASAVPARDWLGKRLLGGANHILRRGPHFREAREKLAALARFADAACVDVAVNTGDYTVLGTEPELEAAAAAVAPIADGRRFGLVTVPGNHDLYVPDTVREGRFEKHFGKYLRTDRPDLATDGIWPMVRLVGDEVAFVCVASARPNPQPWRSTGLVPEAQLAGLAAALDALADRFVVVLTHYAIRGADGRPDTYFHRLENADALLSVIAERERVCLLHGHVHRRYVTRLPGVRPTILGAGSTTYEGREGVWLLELGRDGGTAQAVRWAHHGFELASGEVVELR